MIRAASCFVFAILCAEVALAQTDPAVIEKLIAEGRERNQVMQHLDELVNGIGPRLTSSDRLTQAQEWAVERLKGYGLDARLEPWGTFPVGFNRGPWSGRIVEPTERALTFTTLAWTPGTKGRQRGPAMRAPQTTEELAAKKADLAGRWILEDFPMDIRARESAIPRELRTALDAAYAEMGVLGVIRSTGSDLVRTSGNYQITWETRPTLVKINMAKPDFDAIVAAMSGEAPVVLEFDIRNYWRPGPIQLYNVVADLKGTEKPDEYVIVGGHIDSWDGATGTTDNGTGTSTTIEAARLLAVAGAKPKRTIRFMLWSGEEQGLLGSRAYIRQHQELVDKISAVLVHDGGTNYVSGIAATPAMEPLFREVFAPAMTLSKEMPFELSVSETLRQGGGSDHASFLAFGIPGFFWNQSGRVNYGYGWHTQNDTYDIAVPEYQRHTAMVAAIGAYGIANLPEMLPRAGIRSTAEALPSARVLGVRFKEGTLVIESISEDGKVARAAGLAAGDEILEIDGLPVKDRFVFRDQIQGGEPKKTMLVFRAGERVKLDLQFER